MMTTKQLTRVGLTIAIVGTAVAIVGFAITAIDYLIVVRDASDPGPTPLLSQASMYIGLVSLSVGLGLALTTSVLGAMYRKK